MTNDKMKKDDDDKTFVIINDESILKKADMSAFVEYLNSIGFKEVKLNTNQGRERNE